MKFLNTKAVSIIEYLVLFIIVIMGFLVMKTYIQRGLYGNAAKTGQSFAFGRQFDPQKTIECGFDETTNLWYDYNCFEYYKNLQNCNDPNCETSIITGSCTVSSSSWCNNLNNGTSP
jgi:hypothetical protein